jgi:hypothetical protein
MFDHRFCCILAQMNLSTVWYGLQSQAFQEEAASNDHLISRQHPFCAFCRLVFDHRFCCTSAQMNSSTVWYGLQNQAFQGAAYIAAIRRKKQEVFFLFSSPICGPASETQGRLQRRPGNTPHGLKPQPLKTAFQQKSACFVAEGSVLR